MHRDNFKLNHMPLYLQIKEKLAQDIRDKKYKYGEKLPSELELAAMFGVSRSTLREAVRALAQEGLVSIRRGLGTFVTGTRLDISVISRSCIVSLRLFSNMGGLQAQLNL